MIRAVALVILSMSSIAFAETKAPTASLSTETKSRVWVFESTLLRYTQEANAGHAVDGMGAKFGIGYGVIRPHYFLLANADFYLGPFGTNFQTARLDYQGTGFGMVAGHSLQKRSLREHRVGLGVLSGINYQEFVGKSYARNDVDDPPPSSPDGIVTHYSSRFMLIDASFGFFMSFMRAPRLDTHDQDALITRNEGLLIALQAAFPMMSRFRASYERLDSTGLAQTVVERGSVHGFRLLLSVKAFLGT